MKVSNSWKMLKLVPGLLPLKTTGKPLRRRNPKLKLNSHRRKITRSEEEAPLLKEEPLTPPKKELRLTTRRPLRLLIRTKRTLPRE